MKKQIINYKKSFIIIVLVRAQIPATVTAAVLRPIRRVRSTRSASRVVKATLKSRRGGRNMTATAGIPMHTITYISGQQIVKNLRSSTHWKAESATASLFRIFVRTIAMRHSILSVNEAPKADPRLALKQSAQTNKRCMHKESEFVTPGLKIDFQDNQGL